MNKDINTECVRKCIENGIYDSQYRYNFPFGNNEWIIKNVSIGPRYDGSTTKVIYVDIYHTKDNAGFILKEGTFLYHTSRTILMSDYNNVLRTLKLKKICSSIK